MDANHPLNTPYNSAANYQVCVSLYLTYAHMQVHIIHTTNSSFFSSPPHFLYKNILE